MNEIKCNHKRIKKNFSHGRKSKADKFCKDCGKVVSNKEIREIRGKELQGRRRNKRR